jgi:hypothetical protein
VDSKKPCKPSGCRSLTRRNFVLLSALGPAAAATAARAQEAEPAPEPTPEPPKWGSFRATKEAAGYIVYAEPATQDCASCHSFIPPDDCLLVEPPVHPQGWCNWYSD